MTDDEKIRLNKLKTFNLKKKREKLSENQKNFIRNQIDNFSQKCRFADHLEINKLKKINTTLPYSSPYRINFDYISESNKVSANIIENCNVWICFLCGSEELFDIFVLTTVKEFFNEYDNWYSISPYLLLITEDLSSMIYIDNNRQITKSKIPSLCGSVY